MAKIEVKLFDVAMTLPPSPPDVMLALYAPTPRKPESPAAKLRGNVLALRRRPGEIVLFRLKPETARYVAEVGSVLFAESSPTADYRVAVRVEPDPVKAP
jgi:hypothetical protein